jgi:hypothetical protein
VDRRVLGEILSGEGERGRDHGQDGHDDGTGDAGHDVLPGIGIGGE